MQTVHLSVLTPSGMSTVPLLPRPCMVHVFVFAGNGAVAGTKHYDSSIGDFGRFLPMGRIDHQAEAAKVFFVTTSAVFPPAPVLLGNKERRVR